MRNVLTEVGDLLAKMDELDEAFDAGGPLAMVLVDTSRAAAFRFHPGVSAAFDSDGLPAGIVVDHARTSTLTYLDLATAIIDVVAKTQDLVLAAFDRELQTRLSRLFDRHSARCTGSARTCRPCVD